MSNVAQLGFISGLTAFFFIMALWKGSAAGKKGVPIYLISFVILVVLALSIYPLMRTWQGLILSLTMGATAVYMFVLFLLSLSEKGEG